jgi:tRNA(adenine34) deaminase
MTLDNQRDEYWMQRALALAEQGAAVGEVPVGAVLVLNDEIIGAGYNAPISRHDPTAHAEIIALRSAAEKIANYRLVDTTLYVTLEPCSMCAGALVHARVKRLVYGALEPRAGAITSQLCALDHSFLNHHVEHVGNILAQECGEMLSRFFKARR